MNEPCHPPRPGIQGFSLVELMTVIAISAILLGIGMPSFSLLMENQRMTSTANEFFAAINLTRSEAIRRGTRVDLVPVDGSNWNNGWVVFVDEDADQAVDDGETVIFTYDAAPTGITITSSLTDRSPLYLAYAASGRTRTNSSGSRVQYGNFRFESTNQSRKIIINYLGRPRVCNPATDKSTC